MSTFRIVLRVSNLMRWQTATPNIILKTFRYTLNTLLGDTFFVHANYVVVCTDGGI